MIFGYVAIISFVKVSHFIKRKTGIENVTIMLNKSVRSSIFRFTKTASILNVIWLFKVLFNITSRYKLIGFVFLLQYRSYRQKATLSVK